MKMEKDAVKEVASQITQRRGLISTTARLLSAAILSVFLLLNLSNRTFPDNTLLSKPVFKETTWGDIIPSEELVYHTCYERFKCARLSVPMDRGRTHGNISKVHIALLKLPAKVPITDKRYGGLVLVNPGGPGGSGVRFVESYGQALQSMVDSPQDPSEHSPFDTTNDAKYFDIVGWDPRGVNLTTPHASCFTSALHSRVWRRSEEYISIEEINTRFSSTWASWQSRNKYCTARWQDPDQDNIAENMNTTPLVEDMVDIIEVHGAWREKETKRLVSKSTGSQRTKDLILKKNSYIKGEEKLLYWGFSYGTVIGAYFAAMHPEKVSRLIIDGVVNTDGSYNLIEDQSLVSTDAVFDKFLDFCFAAGPEKCAFYSLAGTTAMKKNYEELLLNLEQMPIISTSRLGPGIVDVVRLKWLIFLSLYSPLTRFPSLAKVLSDLFYKKEGESFAELYSAMETSYECPSQKCKFGDFSDGADGLCGSSDEAGEFVMCTDKNDVARTSFKAAKQFIQEHHSASKIGGAQIGMRLMSCADWPFKPKSIFRGPFSSNNTAHPLLIISNTLDPITPLASAQNVSAKFEGSIVVEQKAQGHCSIGGGPGPCIIDIVRRYFQTGEMPKKGTSCEPFMDPFLGPRIDAKAVQEEHAKALQALNKASESGFIVGRPWTAV